MEPQQNLGPQNAANRPRQHLLVLEINNLLFRRAQFNSPEIVYSRTLDAVLPSGNSVYLRPHYTDFIRFCLSRFVVGIFTTLQGEDLKELISLVVGELKERIVITHDRSRCFSWVVDDTHRHVFNGNEVAMKNMKYVWDGTGFDDQHTLPIDPNPISGVLNMPNTVTFPFPYYPEHEDDDFLFPTEPFCSRYLADMCNVDEIPPYVESRRWGQPHFTHVHPYWPLLERYIQVYHDLQELGVLYTCIPNDDDESILALNPHSQGSPNL